MRARRPPLWFNLLVFFLGLAGLIVAVVHESRLDAHYARINERSASLPYQTAKIRSELASMDGCVRLGGFNHSFIERDHCNPKPIRIEHLRRAPGPDRDRSWC